MTVIIGIDPHKASHTAVAIGCEEQPLAEIKVRATCAADSCGCWRGPNPLDHGYGPSSPPEGMGFFFSSSSSPRANRSSTCRRRWPRESGCSAPGAPIRTTRTMRCRWPLLPCGHPGSDRSSPPTIGEVLAFWPSETTRSGGSGTSSSSRLHAALLNLSPGGISKELNASDAMQLLNDFDPVTPVEQIRFDLAHELLDDVERVNRQLKVSHRRIKEAVRASGTLLTDLYDVGPSWPLPDRLHRRRPSVLQPEPVRLLCRCSSHRTLLGWQGRPPSQPPRQPAAQPRHPHGGHLSDPPEGLRRSGLLRAEGGRGQDQAGSDLVPQASGQQRRLSTAPHRRTEVRAREDKRERLMACVVSSAPWRPALRQSHSRTHQTLGTRALRRRPGLSRQEAQKLPS